VRTARLLAVSAGLVLLLSVSSCGGGSSGGGGGGGGSRTYTATITGAAAGTQVTETIGTVNVTVNQ
jgi:hypothetical protein